MVVVSVVCGLCVLVVLVVVCGLWFVLVVAGYRKVVAFVGNNLRSDGHGLFN